MQSDIFYRPSNILNGDGRRGKVAGKFVLYLGENLDTEAGVAYRNAEQFLKSLPEISLESGMEEIPSEEEAQGLCPTM